jgi:tRNA pseudouridine65 synthase
LQIMNENPTDELELLYRDEQVVAINKPSGLLVHRSPIDRHETRFALQLLRDQLGQRVYPVHRLDKPTSGVLVFALTPEMARELSEQFQNRSLEKRYLAVTRGYTPEEGEIDHPLSDKPDKIADRDRQQPRPPQQAITRYRRLATVELPVQVDRYPQSRFSLVELKPVTGRKHQLRRHMKHIGHPIIGDAKHGKGTYNRYFAEHLNCNRLLLACTSLTFAHPLDGKSITVQAALDDTFSRLLHRFGWSVNN